MRIQKKNSHRIKKKKIKKKKLIYKKMYYERCDPRSHKNWIQKKNLKTLNLCHILSISHDSKIKLSMEVKFSKPN